MKHYDEWISQRDLHEQYESGWLAELAYREALKWVKYIIIHESNGPSNPKDLMEWLNGELKDED